MALTPGTRLGVYDITVQIGVGGMGEVYRATDSNLKRSVAIKVLPASVASDADRLARFQREAEVLAALNHPNIAAIFGLEKTPDCTALVMELVDGEDLSQRIGRGAIPIDEALPIAKQIAEALEAAHEQGIIHRDLKPANIKVRPDGTVKVLDFGLARIVEASEASGSGGSGRSGGTKHWPTITSPAMTQAGMILGTAAYMAPEQARGKSVDERADIWAFGAVLFEMLTGTRAFGDEDVSMTLSKVLQREPDFDALPFTVPARVSQALRVCLQKDPKQRMSDIRDVRLALEGAFETVGPHTTPAAASAAPRGWLAWIAALAVAAVLIAAMAVPTLRHLRETLPSEMRVEISTPSTPEPLQFALSPDGSHLVFVASGDGPTRLWLRPLDRSEAQPLAGTEGATYPFWSADSRSIGFFSSTRLYRLDLAGGAPQSLANIVGSGRGGTWSASGTILFGSTLGPLSRVSASGGEPVAVTRLDPPRQTGHRFPHFHSDGRHFLFYAVGPQESSGLYLGSLDGGDARRLTAADASGAFLEPDRLVFLRQGTLVTRRLDLAHGELTGDPITVVDRAGFDATTFFGGFSLSADGTLAYRAGGAGSMQLTWFDRTGKAVGVAGAPDTNGMQHPELSPEGRRVAMQRTVQGNTDTWLMDLVRGGLTRLTFDAAQETNPVWLPDGMRIGFSSARKGAFDLYQKPSNGSGAEDVVLEGPTTKIMQDWSKDGRFLLYYEVNAKTGRDLWAKEMTGTNRQLRVVANTPFEETLAQFSPDGHWVAYQTSESGRFEIVVQPFPDPGGKWQVSTGGGVAPRWRADGKEIYFLAPDATMMATPVTAAGPAFETGTPVALFHTRILGGGAVATNRPQYAVARDGRFLINQPVKEAAATPITLVLHWRPPAKP